MKPYTYLLINFFSILIPFLFSFEKRIFFFKKLKALLPAILITGIFFIIWDHFMTIWKVWEFNNEYLIGYYLWDLPVEEWLFFFTIPYSCVFIYESLNFLIKKDTLSGYSKNISGTLAVILIIVVLFNTGKLYTAIKLTLTVFMLVYVLIENFDFMGKFYRAYLVSLIPFFAVNGLLTALPVVTYDDSENLGIRLGTIPVEDTIYALLLLLMNICLYEYFKKRLIKDVKPQSKY